MPTIMTHAIIPLTIAAAALAMRPDADVIGFGFGIDYANTWGHRGATHSLAFALVAAGAIALVWQQARSLWIFVFLTIAMASHGLLDAFTDGGLGPALWWPFSDARVFAPATPIRVSPIGANFFSMRGLETLKSEMLWIWLPCLALTLGLIGLRRACSARDY